MIFGCDHDKTCYVDGCTTTNTGQKCCCNGNYGNYSCNDGSLKPTGGPCDHNPNAPGCGVVPDKGQSLRLDIVLYAIVGLFLAVYLK